MANHTLSGVSTGAASWDVSNQHLWDHKTHSAPPLNLTSSSPPSDERIRQMHDRQNDRDEEERANALYGYLGQQTRPNMFFAVASPYVTYGLGALWDFSPSFWLSLSHDYQAAYLTADVW
ncbi:hypothetical protein AcW1_009957 [Taiwanofungus camphoratus]|nr:hypothetical protein AcW1_009957 [Antrodia cinnamomea]